MNKNKLFFTTQLILVAALSVIVGLTYLVYQNTYKITTIAAKQVNTGELEKYISRSVSFGKDYNENLGFPRAVDLTLGSVYDDLNIQQILFLDTKGSILYSHENEKKLETSQIPQHFYQNGKIKEITEYNNLFWLSFPLTKSSVNPNSKIFPEIVGTCLIAFNESDFYDKPLHFFEIYTLPIIFSLLLGVVILSYVVFCTPFRIDTKTNVIHKKIYLYGGIILSQAVLSVFLINGLYDFFNKSAVTTVENSLETEVQRINRLLNLGLPLAQYSKGEEFYLKEFAQNKDIDSVRILNPEKEQILEVNIRHSKAEDILPVTYELKSNNGEIYGYLEGNVSDFGIKQLLFSTIADILTVLIISLLAVTEAILFVALPKPDYKHNLSLDPNVLLIPVSYMRTAVSIFTFSTTLAMSFLPLTVLTMLEEGGFYGLDPLVISGLPTTLEYVACLFALLFVGTVSDKYGWQVSFIFGALVYGLGSLISAFADTPLALIAARAVAGFGYGFAWLSSQAFIFAHVPPNKRAFAFALNVAGIYTGYIAGVSTGGIIASQLDPKIAFLVAAFVCLCAVAFVLIFMPAYFVDKKKKINNEEDVNTVLQGHKNVFELTYGKANLWSYITDRNIFAATFLILIPFSLVQIGLLNYGVPMALTSLGFSTSSIGRAIMLYGLVQIYIAPKLTKACEPHKNKKMIIFSGVALILCAFFATNINPYMLFPAIFLLGIAGALIGPSQSAFAANQLVAERLGVGKAVSIQRFADKSGQALGPLMFGILFTHFTFSVALSLLSVGFLALGSVFLVFAKNKDDGKG